MTTLMTAGATEALEERLGRLSPEAERRWGSMSIEGMLCHLNDSYTGLLQSGYGDGHLRLGFARALLRVFALHMPLRWPHGLPTPPEVDQAKGGTPPTSFEADRDAFALTLRRFARARDFEGKVHPIFGRMSEWEWMRWGWMHADHHLRQFHC